jgi:hypothetical protein
VVIANGIHNGAFLFEKDVQERVIQMGLIIKWLIVIVGNPLIAAFLSGIMFLFVR